MRRATRLLALAAPLASGLAAALLPMLVAPAAHAQSPLPGGRAMATDEPVTFTAEEVEFDQTSGVVSARGRVEAWQGNRVLRADRFTYDRNTGVATAEGNVVLIEPDGQVLFADRAELSGGMRDAALEGLRGLLAANARIAAAGGRRTDGRVMDLARVVYSPCNLCAEDPDRPPLWQLRARIASLHQDEQRVRYRDAAVEFGGWPLLYTPYLSHAAPGAARVSGFLSPTFGYTKLLGAFTSLPFYWAIDDQSDALLTTQLSSEQVGNLGVAYRRRFNTGALTLDGSIGNLQGPDVDLEGLGWHLYLNGTFALDETWRTGFGLNRASSRDYVRTWRYGAPQTLISTAYLEGFWGVEGYARTDTRLYQSLLRRSNTGQIPFVLPFGFAEWSFAPDAAGGRFTLDTQGYSLFREAGTDSRRIATRLGYELPLQDSQGAIWTVRARADLLAGHALEVDQAPFYGPAGSDGGWTNGNIRAALDWRWPLMRSAGDWGAQVIEPRVQFVTGPNTGLQSNIPPEDSLDLEFTDATLFALNRFAGRDRQEGGTRVDAAMRSAWLFPNGGQVEGLVGRSFRASTEALFPAGSGLENRASDWVARARLSPVPWFEITGRTRLDGEGLEPNLWDVSGTVFAGRFSLTAGYLESGPAPLGGYGKRDEWSLGGQVRLDQNWRLGGFGRYDQALDRPVAAAASLAYEDECLVFETLFARRWAEDAGSNETLPGSTLVMFRLTLKTVGDIALRAL
jgi:LPS-assembly protein